MNAHVLPAGAKASGPVQKQIAKKRKALVVRSPLIKRSLKRVALRMVEVEVRPSFGFVPADADIEVLSWPKL